MRVDLLGGTYLARSIIADAQRCVNLYPERNPKDAEAPVTHYPTPGLVTLATPASGVARGLYTATNRTLFYCVDSTLYKVDASWTLTPLGTLLTNPGTPVSMVDNGNVLILVDGSKNGYAVDLNTLAFAQITDPSFVGADRVDYVDTFFVFNQPNSRNFYCSLSNVTYAQLTNTPAGSIITGNLIGNVYWANDGTYTNVPLVYTVGTLVDESGTILLTGQVIGGSGGTDGVYQNVALTGGSGTSATATITVTGGTVTGILITFGGTGYAAGDILSAPSASIGNTVGFSVALGGNGALATITVSHGQITSVVITSPGSGYSAFDVLGVDSTVLGVPTVTVPNYSNGSGYTNGTYTNVPMKGGSGSGMRATVVVSATKVATVTVTTNGLDYQPGDALTANPADIGGTGSGLTAFLSTGAITTAGSGYSASKTWDFIPMTGGSGSGMQNHFHVSGAGVVESSYVEPNLQGSKYQVGDVLTVDPQLISAKTSDPQGDGFSYTVTPLPYGFGYEVGNIAAFEPTFLAAKTGFPDLIATLVVVHREIWLFGAVKTTEVWYDSGGATFPFAILPGVFIEQGCVAKYSVAKHDLNVFWLGIDAEGQGTVFMGAGYAANPISTPAISYAFTNYARIDDAVGMMYLQGDHVFYLLSFPSANATWCYDVTEQLWHERVWTDPVNGTENRHRANCFAIAYGTVVCGDWQSGKLYQVSLNAYDDAGVAIVRRRGFPHITNEMNRTTYDKFQANIECGRGIASAPLQQPQLSLRISDTRGRTWRTLPTQSLGAQGQYYVVPQWRQLGMARDMVFELYWSDPIATAINCAYIDVTPTGDPQTGTPAT